MSFGFYILLPLVLVMVAFALVFIFTLIRSIRIVPNKTALIVERLGKYYTTLEAGFHILFPFIDKVRYTQTLKEQAIDVPAQDCFTKDNVQVRIDGILYLQVFNPVHASYGIMDYRYATILLAQTTMRSVVGQLDLDETFEARDRMNAQVVKAVDEASDPWGVKVTRYEIQNIRVSNSIMDAMENQMKAEREKRAEIARSVGEMETVINLSRAAYEEAVNISVGEKERMINEAEGQAKEIVAVAQATAEGIKKIAESTLLQGGVHAAKLSVAEDWIASLSALQKNADIIMTADLSSIKDMTGKAATEMLNDETKLF
ncbi:paraslipin [Treponema phagedenis]|uniref:Paraslipin n=1 Tax=Treponema phagedenis TaxID=162 RepID=A0A0B7GXI6_TREPH|nr:slipin family protein [Treponema phagedenis]EFW39457.1 SPFH/Band 7/PHB domain protein [Treponema phagedenis F0421]NVP24230.1 paraslipin [Treponema phagedenis]QEJ94205.1 paraslipin [Treponema phagedenis]QEJ99210.1 paraslipin [Treponema phagedenis]QEK00163.1 paraslipin [Treponema phagedenis]